MVKEDGHLAIIFHYRGQVIATTRGSFLSPSAKIANELLAEKQSEWAETFLKGMTVLAEFIHPETQVIIDYAGKVEFCLLAAYSKRTLKDLDYPELTKLGAQLGLRAVERYQFSTIDELKAFVKRPEFENKEGFVARWADRRVKFKCAGYIGKMIQEKLNPRYIMLRVLEGKLEEKFADLPFEVKDDADKIVGELMAVTEQPTKTAQLAYLYGLVPEAERTQYHKTVSEIPQTPGDDRQDQGRLISFASNQKALRRFHHTASISPDACLMAGSGNQCRAAHGPRMDVCPLPAGSTRRASAETLSESAF